MRLRVLRIGSRGGIMTVSPKEIEQGPVLGAVSLALGTWDCRMSADAVDCGHTYCREHELVARLKNANAELTAARGHANEMFNSFCAAGRDRDEARVEIDRLRAVTGPDCPRCGHFLKAEHMRSTIAFGRVGCTITIAELISDHPSIARDLGLIV
jgi:hypothetical protein